MPLFRLTTNVAKDSVPKSLSAEIGDILSELTSTPIEHVFVVINADQHVLACGTLEPAAFCDLHEVYTRDHEGNRELSKQLTAKIQGALHIEPGRIAIMFKPLDPERVGRFGTTLATYFAENEKKHQDAHLPAGAIPRNLYADLVDIIRDITGHKKEVITLQINTGQSMYWKDSFEPDMLCELISNVAISPQQNIVSSQKLTDKILSELDIPVERFLITFTKVENENLGKFRTTLAEYLAK